MRTPTRSEIYEKAKEIYAKRIAMEGDLPYITPEYEELRESGLIEEARRELMASDTADAILAEERALAEERDYIRKRAEELGIIDEIHRDYEALIEEKDKRIEELTKRLAELESQAITLEEYEKRLDEVKRSYEKQLEEYRGRLRALSRMVEAKARARARRRSTAPREVVGFYTDEDGVVRPITRRAR